ncbi:Leucine-rich repeat protein 1 [Echinococcus granulosus]|nr:Leucine-rich repeat protein 1 [Echinococcus granulosus]
MVLSCPLSKWTLGFKLKGNIVEVYDRFVREGKFTIRLAEPAQDVLFCKVRPDLAQKLCHFLRDMKNGQKVDVRALLGLGGGLSRAPDVGKLVIEQWRDYPLGKPFPPHLESLHIVNIKLKSFDSRILQLANLSMLSVEKTRISSVPKSVECLRLTRLCLKSNEMETWPSVSRDSALASSLLYLNLSENRLAWLPEDFWNLENLESLLITDNRLGALPAANLHSLKKLRNLQLRNNKLRCLPYAISQFWKLETVSLSDNPWIASFPPKVCDESPKSLFHFASAAFLQNYGHLLPALELQLPRDVELQLQVLRRCFRCHRVCGVEAVWYVEHFDVKCIECIYSCSSVTRREMKPVCIRYCCSSHCCARIRAFDHLV